MATKTVTDQSFANDVLGADGPCLSTFGRNGAARAG